MSVKYHLRGGGSVIAYDAQYVKGERRETN
jgi:hypothetical protein